MTSRPDRPPTTAPRRRPTARTAGGTVDPHPRYPAPGRPLSESACEPGRFSREIPCAAEDRSIAEAGIVLRPSAVRPPAVEVEAARPRLVDCAAGHIETLLLTVPTDLHSGNEPHLEALIAALGPETTYVLLHNRENAETVARWQTDHAIPDARWRPIAAADRWGDSLTGHFQPIFHIDMHVTPTGMVGDSGREVLLFGTPAAAADVVDPSPDFRLQPAFDQLEEWLKRRFEVHCLPLLPVTGTAGVPSWPLQRYYLTWNNVLIESWDNGEGEVARYVFMPVYGPGAEATGLNAEIRHALDELAERTWSDLGFEVRRLTSMEDLAYAGGAAHCISKTLRRGPAPRD